MGTRSWHWRARQVVAGALVVAAAVAWQGHAGTAAADPLAGEYSTQPMIPDAYLGATGDDVIEFAMMPGRPNEAIVVRQSGHIYRVALDGSFSPQLWGDVSTKVEFGGEQGLLAVAFAPDFVTSGRVYLYYTPGSPDPTILARYTATATDLNEASEEILLSVEEFAGNHNGGHIAFDSAGYLYLSLGDGGGGGDPQEKGQALNALLGKVLRLDVSGASGYAIPAGNPFDDGAGPIREEIFAYGFRNPFRMTIDPLTDDVWLGDVGQANWEEVDRVVIGGNYGWDCYEGNVAYEAAGCSVDPDDFEFPRAVYGHSLGQAVTGGYVYRGSEMPELYGWYVYADFYSGRIWAVDPSTTAAAVQLVDTSFNIGSFTLLPDGEIAIVTYSTGVHRLVEKDYDNDLDIASADNCPTWANASQALPPWVVKNDDPDCDGFSTSREDFSGTKDLAQCAANGTANDEAPPDAWPMDFDDDQRVTIADLSTYGPRFGSVGPNPPYGVRWDLNGDDRITIVDVSSFSGFFGKVCTP